jgi:hypothetical protein
MGRAGKRVMRAEWVQRLIHHALHHVSVASHCGRAAAARCAPAPGASPANAGITSRAKRRIDSIAMSCGIEPNQKLALK